MEEAIHGHVGEGIGTWSKICLQVVMLVQTVLGFTQGKARRSYSRRRYRTSYMKAVCTRKGGGGTDGLSTEALGFKYAGNGETNGHI